MTRIQIELTDEEYEHIENLMEKCGFTKKKDYFNTALSLLEWALDEVAEGNQVVSYNEDSHRIREVLLPAFSKIRKASEKKKNIAVLK